MSMTRIVAGMLWVGLMVLGPGGVSGQTYPNKPIRIVAAPVGGNGDLTARIIAQGISGPLGQPVIVENKPISVLGEIVARALPDGYTLLLHGTGFWISPLLQDMHYDPVKDFVPVTLATSSPDVLAVNSSLPVNSVKELIALAKAKPGALNYGSTPSGTSTYLEGELFKSLAGVNIVRIGYQGTGPIGPALAAGELHLAFTSVSSLTPLLKSGKVKILAVASPLPSALVPGVPTVSASLPGFEPLSGNAIFVPAKTPASIVSRLNQEIVRFLSRADIKDKFFSMGAESIGSSAEQVAAMIKANVAMMGKVIKDAGIKSD